MNVISELTLQIHYTIKSISHVCTFFSVILAIITLVVVVLCGSRTSKRYSTLIALLIILGAAGDFVLNIIWDPLMLLPALCIMRENSILPTPGGSNTYYELWVFIIAMNVPVFTACFLERHQAVLSVGSRWLLPMRVRHILIGIMTFFSLLISLSLGLAEMRLDSERALLQTIGGRWPAIDVHRAKCYDRFPFVCFALACVIGICICVILEAMISFHTFSLLGIASTLSETVKRNNKFLSKVLIIQASVPVILMGIPIVSAFIAVFAGAEGPLPYSLANMFISAHSPTHSLILLTVMPAYRKKLVEILKSLTRTKSNSSKVSVMSKSATEQKH